VPTLVSIGSFILFPTENKFGSMVHLLGMITINVGVTFVVKQKVLEFIKGVIMDGIDNMVG
jgi:hypothetical protein